MKKSVLVRKNLDKRSELGDCFNLASVNLAYFRHCTYGINAVKSRPDNLIIVTKDIDHTLAVDLFNDNSCTCCRLNILYDFSAGTDNGTDHLFRDVNLLYPWSMRLKIRPWFCNGLLHYIKYMESAVACLVKSLFQHLK